MGRCRLASSSRRRCALRRAPRYYLTRSACQGYTVIRLEDKLEALEGQETDDNDTPRGWFRAE